MQMRCVPLLILKTIKINCLVGGFWIRDFLEIESSQQRFFRGYGDGQPDSSKNVAPPDFERGLK